MRSALVTAALVFFVNVISVGAQQVTTSPLFLDAAVFAGFEQRAYSDVPSPYASFIPPLNPSQTVAGGSVGAGTFLSPRISLRVEAAFPATLTLANRITLPVGGSGEAKYRGIGMAVLVGVHTTRRHRVALGYLGGVVFLRERQQSPVVITMGPIAGPDFPLNSIVASVNSYTYRLAAQAGVDADLSVARHFSVVPQVRVQAFSGALSIRPGVALRWTM